VTPTKKGVLVSSKFRIPRGRFVASAVAVAVLVVGATAPAATRTGSLVKTRKTTLGTILVDRKGHTLYLFGKDKRGKSACYGACAANWPPYLTAAKPKAGTGIKASLLGTVKRTNGKLQVTYNRHPLYEFKFDKAAGQTTGEKVDAFGGIWYAVSPKGGKVVPASSGSTGSGPTGPTGSGGYGGGGGGYGGGYGGG
jgi:predicted lipoprotein with Yx(FWY)xxD motif